MSDDGALDLEWPDIGGEFAAALDLGDIPNERGERDTIAREAGALFALMHEAVGQERAAEMFEKMAKTARAVRRGRPPGRTEHLNERDRDLMQRYDARPPGMTLTAFAKQVGEGDPSTATRKKIARLDRRRREPVGENGL